MKGEGYARFLELRERRLVEGAGTLWYTVEGRMLMSIPYHTPVHPDLGALETALRRLCLAGARFPSLRYGGVPRGLYVCRKRPYGVCEMYRGRMRNKMRRALEDCEIRPVEESELLSQGLLLNRDTMERQGRREDEFGDERRWSRFVAAVGQSPAIVPLGAFVEGKLAAYAIICREDGWLHILHQMSRRDMFSFHANDALTFAVTRMAMADPSIEAACYGLMGLVDTPGLHEFKLRHGYELEPQNSSVVLHPALAPVLTSLPARWALGSLRRLLAKDQRLQRLEVVLEAARGTGGRPSRTLPLAENSLEVR